MPNRMLRDWTDSDKVHILSAEAERFFVRLIMKVDDFGRYHANVKLLRAYLFPLYVKLNDQKIEGWIKECRDADLITVYESDGKPYLEINSFDQRLRIRRSKFPGADPNSQESPKEGYIYLIGSDFSKPVKIGFSINPWARVKEIALGHPEAVKVLLSIKADQKLERQIHKALKEFQVRSEWFQINEAVLDCLRDLSNNEIDREKAIDTLRSLSSKLRSNYGKIRSTPEAEEEEEEKIEEEGKPEGAGSGEYGNERLLVPQMLHRWKESNPAYPDDARFDATALYDIAKFLCKRGNLRGDPVDNIEQVLEAWGNLCDVIMQMNFYKQKSLKTISYNIQEILQKALNGDQSKPSEKPGRKGLDADKLKAGLSARFAERRQGAS